MRIPVGSCPACLKNEKIYPNGHHSKTEWYLCPFVAAELQDIPDAEFISVHNSRNSAKRASGKFGAIHWIGQSPRDMWLVLKPLSL